MTKCSYATRGGCQKSRSKVDSSTKMMWLLCTCFCCSAWKTGMGLDKFVNPGQVEQAKKGEQVLSGLSSSLEVSVTCSLQQSSSPQQGTNVPASVIKSSNEANHFFIGHKSKIRCLYAPINVCSMVAEAAAFLTGRQ